jgi:hypothetical protein
MTSHQPRKTVSQTLMGDSQPARFLPSVKRDKWTPQLGRHSNDYSDNKRHIRTDRDRLVIRLSVGRHWWDTAKTTSMDSQNLSPDSQMDIRSDSQTPQNSQTT